LTWLREEQALADLHFPSELILPVHAGWSRCRTIENDGGFLMSRRTTFFRLLVKTGVLPAAIALATAPAAPAIAASGPLQLIYLIPGVRDDGAAINLGLATSIHCFSFSGVAETVQYVVRDFDGTLKANLTLNVTSLSTRTASTHGTVLYNEDLFLGTGLIDQGVVGILATTTSMVCTAHVIDASAGVPNGIDLHPMRFNPIPGVDE
jgi:hypothetical protein